MIDPALFALAAGSSILTLVGLYIGWRSYRVFLLRLHLLQIRNRLWDEVQAVGCLDDETYRRVRSQLNDLIRYAHRIDMVSLALTTELTDSERDSETPDLFDSIRAVQPELRVPLESAMRQVGCCMGRYVLWYRPLTGILLYWLASAATKVYRLAHRSSRKRSQIMKQTARVREFGTQPDKGSRKWFEHNGPRYFSGHCPA